MHGNGPGTDNFFNTDGAQNINNCLYLGFRSGDFNGIGGRADINNLASEDIDNPSKPRPWCLASALTRISTISRSTNSPSADVGYLNDINQFMKLFGDLFNDGVIAAGDQGQAGDLGVQGLCHTKAFNVEATATEQACHPGEGAWFILK